MIRKEGLAGSGMLWVNADGAQLRGCRADDTLIISQASNRSGRPTVVEDCEFATLAGDPVIQDSVTTPVRLVRTTLRGLEGVAFAGTGPVVLADCRLQAADGAGSVTAAGDLTITGGSLDHVRVSAAGDRSQTIRLHGVSLSGTPAGETFLGRDEGEGHVEWQLDAVTSEAGDGVSHATIAVGPSSWSALGCRFARGSLDLAPAAFTAEDCYVRHSGNVEQQVARHAFPDGGPRTLLEPNLTL